MLDVHSRYSGATKKWSVVLDGEEIHTCDTPYERDMFIAELKARLKILENYGGLVKMPQKEGD